MPENILTYQKSALEMTPQEVKEFAHKLSSPMLLRCITMCEKEQLTWEQAMQVAAVEFAKLVKHLEIENSFMLERMPLNFTLTKKNYGYRKAPWPDYKGNDIYEGDTICHPSGEKGLVFYQARSAIDESDNWLVQYDGGPASRLSLQIGEKGGAVKQMEPNH